MLERLTELRETFAGVYSFIIRDMIKDTDEESDEEVRRARSRRVPTQELLSLWTWGVSPSACGCVDQSRSFPTT